MLQRIYGADNTGLESIPKAYEPPKEVKIRYRNFKILTITAFVLLFAVLTQSIVIHLVRFLLEVAFIKELVVFISGVCILAIGIVLWIGYGYIWHSLTYTNLIILIIAELSMLVGQLVLISVAVPDLLKIMLILSVVFILYVLIFFKCKFLYKAIISVTTVFFLVISNITHLHSMEFTPRYIYISTAGFQDKVSDEVSYYYEEPVNTYVDGQHSVDKLLSEINEFSKYAGYIQTIEEVDNRSYLKYLDLVVAKDIFCLSDIVNFNGEYDDSFFESTGLGLSVIELENPDDTIKCTEYQYSVAYGRPVIEYTRGNSPATDERAICIIVYEISKEYTERIEYFSPSFNPRKSTIHYR